MNFYEWRKSDTYSAKKFRAWMSASGDDGTSDTVSEQMKASGEAYAAGIEEGKRQAASVLSELVIRGLPEGEILFR
jgi:hypothetical protein